MSRTIPAVAGPCVSPKIAGTMAKNATRDGAFRKSAGGIAIEAARASAAVACGVMIASPFVGIGGPLPLIVGAGGLFALCGSLAPASAAALGFLAGAAWFLTGLYPLARVTPAGYAAASLLLAIYTAAFGAACGPAWRRGGTSGALAAAGLWTLLEIIRGRIPIFGFPWMLAGHSFSGWTLASQIADIFGVYGLSFLAVFTGAALFRLGPQAFGGEVPAAGGAWRNGGGERAGAPGMGFPSSRSEKALGADRGFGEPDVAEPSDAGSVRPGAAEPSVPVRARMPFRFRDRRVSARLGIALCAATWAAAILYGAFRVASYGEKLGPKVLIIQPNVASKVNLSAEEKDAMFLRSAELQRAAMAAAESPPDLVVWPETMLPGRFELDDYSERLRRLQAERPAPMLVGSDFVRNPEVPDVMLQDWYNSAILLDASGRVIGRHDKIHLVPFGEYIPFSDRFPSLKRLATVTRDKYSPGQPPARILALPDGTRLGASICFEDIFPDLAARQAAAGIDILINLTNDGWFDGTHEPIQHMRFGIFRAIETRRPMIRATNTGLSVVIDALGAVRDRLPAGSPCTLLTRIPMPANEMASFYAAVGDWWWVVFALLAVRGRTPSPPHPGLLKDRIYGLSTRGRRGGSSGSPFHQPGSGDITSLP